MLTHHPTTGEPIRILHTNTQIHSDLKTLVWIRDTFQTSARWSRWFPILTEPGALAVCSNAPITAVLLSADSDLDAWLPVLPTIFSPTSETLLVGPTDVVHTLAQRGFTCENTLLHEELFDGYPYLSEPIHAHDPYEKVILSLAHILRMNKIVWTSGADRDALSGDSVRAQYDVWKSACDGILQQIPQDSDDSCIPRTWLIQQYFKHSSNRRGREIHICLERNLQCAHIDHILLLNEEHYPDIPESPKLQTVLLGHRLTYYDVFQAIRTYVPAGAFVIIANADIWCNETLNSIWSIRLAEKQMCLALLRWEDTGAGTSSAAARGTIFGPRPDSQDAWIVARDCITFTPTEAEFGFAFGKSCCDNAFAITMMRKRFLVVNPAYTIRIMHLHTSNIRNYDPKDMLYRSHYLYIEPTAIQPCALLYDLSKYTKLPSRIARRWQSCTLRQSFVRPILSIHDDTLHTVCSALHAAGDESYAAHDQNLWTPPPHTLPLYNVTGGTFVTATGLLSNFQGVFLGKHTAWANAWAEPTTQHNSLMHSIHIPNMIALPCSEECMTSLSTWCLQYLPRVLTIRRIIQQAGLPVPEFLVPQIRDIGSFLNDCVWAADSGSTERHTLTVSPMMSDMNYYSEHVWAVPPEQGRTHVTMEDIDLLRSLLPRADTPTEEKTGPVAVICVDDDKDALCTHGWAEEVADKILSRGWKIRYVGVHDTPSTRRKAYAEATWIFGSGRGSALDWMWYAAPGTTIMEFMPDSGIVSDRIHLAGAARLRYVVSLVKQEERIEYQRQRALVDVGRAVQKYGFKELMDVTRASNRAQIQLVVPSSATSKGLWEHTGREFREMMGIWADRGYVNIESNEHTRFCWWGSVGEVLLYDRPTTRWWSTIPSYQMALFGNCAPPGPDTHLLRQSRWCYWPQSPRAIESIVSRSANMLGYNARKIRSLFLGKVENGVQYAHRTSHNWSTAVDLFSMPIDSMGKPYPYTQNEYLEKLCSARFGLCLPGIGGKCNREIEYFACGCVPIVTPGVDMTGYLVPPVEGIHYLVANTPEDVTRIVTETPAHVWITMSAAGRAWWQAYASAEGLFRLTWARIEQCRSYLNVGIPRYFMETEY